MEVSARLTTHIMLAFGAETRVAEAIEDLKGRLVGLVADEVGYLLHVRQCVSLRVVTGLFVLQLRLAEDKELAMEQRGREEELQLGVGRLLEEIRSAGQCAEELEAARLVLNEQLSASSNELASLAQPVSLEEELRVDMEVSCFRHSSV